MAFSEPDDAITDNTGRAFLHLKKKERYLLNRSCKFLSRFDFYVFHFSNTEYKKQDLQNQFISSKMLIKSYIICGYFTKSFKNYFILVYYELKLLFPNKDQIFD